MADKAILFDSSRCSACQACVVACRAHFGMGARDEGEEAVTVFGRAVAPDGASPLAVTLTERQDGERGLVWEAHREGCVHCVEAPCAEVCPTGSLAVNETTGFVALDASRCVGCHLCAMVCPADAPRHVGERAGVCLCDGCSGSVADGGVPACVAACPLDALAFDDREAVVTRANERAQALRERGWDRAQVLGVGEQGGHHVIQVLKYGVAGGPHEALANTGEVEWLDAAKMAGPVSVGVLGAAAVGAVAGFAVESRKQRVAAEAAAASAAEAAAAGINPLWVEDEVALDESAPVVEESALDAALRRREALRSRKGATPAAAAAAAAAAVPDEAYHWYVVEDEVPQDSFRLVACGRDRFGMKDFGDAGEADGLSEDTGELFSVDELEDTGELYNLEDFQRLLAEDAALAAASESDPGAMPDEPTSTLASDEACEPSDVIDAAESEASSEPPESAE